jgi:hypothetical protein
MSITALRQRPDIQSNSKLDKMYVQFNQLLGELSRKSIPDEVVSVINTEVDAINASTPAGNELQKILKKKQTEIVTLVEKKLKIVPKNYYRMLWLPVGMAAFGLPLGVGFGIALSSMAFLGLGLPIGMAIGMAVGSGMDKKAAAEGRQLDVEIKY